MSKGDQGITHSAVCWKWHRACFRRKLQAALDDYEGAGLADAECRVTMLDELCSELWIWGHAREVYDEAR